MERRLIFVLGGLIGLSLILAHISSAFNSHDAVLNMTNSAIILLIQIFAAAASYLIGSQLKKDKESKGS